MDLSFIFRDIASFFEDHHEEDGNWADLLDLYLEYVGYDVSEMSAEEQSDPRNVVAIGDHMVYVANADFMPSDCRRYGIV